MHDVAGIHHHLEHGEPGEPTRLTDCFVPRFAAPANKGLL
jgi:hypothetical protein